MHNELCLCGGRTAETVGAGGGVVHTGAGACSRRERLESGVIPNDNYRAEQTFPVQENIVDAGIMIGNCRPL